MIWSKSYLMLSVCVLYSMMVFGGRFKTLLRVSRMRRLMVTSLEVLFQMEMMSSCKIAEELHVRH